jgi:hypothetical protein
MRLEKRWYSCGNSFFSEVINPISFGFANPTNSARIASFHLRNFLSSLESDMDRARNPPPKLPDPAHAAFKGPCGQHGPL